MDEMYAVFALSMCGMVDVHVLLKENSEHY